MLKRRKKSQCLGTVADAYLGTGTQIVTDSRPLDLSEDTPEVVRRQLDAANPGRLAAGHAGDR